MPALPPLMSLLGVHALLVVNAVTRSLKMTAQSRAVRSSRQFASNPIYQDWIRSDFSTRIDSNLNCDNMNIFLNQLIQFYSNNAIKSSPLNYTQYDMFPHKIEIVL